jgi:hypothetical protein
MAYDKSFIGPLKSGLQKNVKPFLIADDAFELLENAYLFRGAVRKRFGSRLMQPSTKPVAGYESLSSRLRVDVGTTTAAGAVVAGAIPGVPLKVGGMISVTGLTGAGVAGTDLFTIIALGVPATLLTNRPAATCTVNTTTGAYDITASRVSSKVYYYPAEPVMGFITDESSAINEKDTYAFDTHFAYRFTTTGWLRMAGEAVAGDALWSGTNSDFFWGDTFRGVTSNLDVLFVVNGVDTIRWWNQVTSVWTTLLPRYNADATAFIQSAKIVVAFKNRLVLMNIVQIVGATKTTYKSRIRFSVNGSPTDADAWREDIPGKGGWIDLPVQEAIVTAQHLRDRVIVYCERSTWELVYTGNEILPFVFQQINTELGAESTFSQVPFDDAVLGVGNVGIHACNGTSVKRIDSLIPDEVFAIKNLTFGVKRVAGIRDYFLEHVYWTMPSGGQPDIAVYPNKILVYNYAANTYAMFDDSITAWGYIQDGFRGLTWAELIAPLTWATWLTPWNTATNEQNTKNRNILAGNQQGFTFVVLSKEPTNSASLAIANITPTATDYIQLLVKDHNLQEDDYVYIENCQGLTNLNGLIVKVDSIDLADPNIVTVELEGGTIGAYLGGGTISRVSRINILTKDYNFYKEKAQSFFVAQVDFNVDTTESGEISVEYSTASSKTSISQAAMVNGSMLGSTTLSTHAYALVPLEASQSQVWHPVYLQAEGNSVQLRLYLSDDQMLMANVRESDFQLNMMIFYTQSSGRL